MKKILVTLFVLLLGTSLSSADFLDRGVSHRPNRINPFVSQQMVKPPVEQKLIKPPVGQKSFSRKMRAYHMQPLLGTKMPAETQTMRPGRNHDNPAANRFGDGSEPNKYIWGGGKNQQMP